MSRLVGTIHQGQNVTPSFRCLFWHRYHHCLPNKRNIFVYNACVIFVCSSSTSKCNMCSSVTKRELCSTVMEKRVRNTSLHNLGIVSRSLFNRARGRYDDSYKGRRKKLEHITARYNMCKQLSRVNTILSHNDKPSSGSTAHRQLR